MSWLKLATAEGITFIRRSAVEAAIVGGTREELAIEFLMHGGRSIRTRCKSLATVEELLADGANVLEEDDE